MSTVSAQNYKDPSTEKSVDASYLTDGLAKVWVLWDSTGTMSITDSLNSASITDTGTGQATHGITSAFASANYCALADNDQIKNSNGCGGSVYGKTTSQCQTYQMYGNAYIDWATNNLILMGDLA